MTVVVFRPLQHVKTGKVN